MVSASFQSPRNPVVTEHAQTVCTSLFTLPTQEPGNNSIPKSLGTTLPLSMRVVCFGGTATSAFIYGVVPMVEMAHMVVAGSWTILAPGLFVEVVPLGGGGGAVSWAMSWACRVLPTLGLGGHTDIAPCCGRVTGTLCTMTLCLWLAL